MMDEHSINGSSIQRRRQEASSSVPTERGGREGSSSSSSASSSAAEEKRIQAQVNSLRRDLLLAVALPFLVLVWLAGTGGLYCLTFGGLVCYILDLLESVEGTLISFGLTLLCFFGTVLFAVRAFLAQSFLHFALVPIVFSLLCCAFFAVAAQFTVILSEFDSLSSFISQIVLLLLPVLSSALLALVLALELPDYELHTLFTCFYFAYTLYFCRPRVVCVRRVRKSSLSRVVTYEDVSLLSVATQRVVYALPVCVSLCVHYALHRHMALTQRTRVLSLLNALTQPILLMLYCARHHLRLSLTQSSVLLTDEHTRSRQRQTLSLLTHIFYGTLCVQALCVLPSPAFDELRRFSGLKEPVPTYLLLSVCILAVCALLVQRRREMYRTYVEEEKDSHSHTQSQQWLYWCTLFRLLLNVLVSVMAVLCALLVSVPSRVLPVVAVAACALCEFHLEESWSVGARAALGLAAALGVLIAFVAFCKGTVYYLLFGFSWHAVLHHDSTFSLSIVQFCQLIATLLAVAALLPSLISSSFTQSCSSIWLRGSEGGGGERERLGLLAGGRVHESKEEEDTPRDVVRAVFSTGLLFVAVVTASLELIVLDQDWMAIVSVPAEVVYPSYWLLLTAGLFVTSGGFLYKNGSIGLTTLLLLALVHAGKLLVLWDVSSSMIVTLVVLGCAFLLPFIRQLSLYLEHADELERALSSAEAYSTTQQSAELHKTLLLSDTELLLCVVLCALCCVALGRNVANLLVSFVLHGDLSIDFHDQRVSLWQEALVVLGVFCGYCGCVLFVFHRHAKYLRSALFGACLLSLLLAFEGFGALMISAQGIRLVDANTVTVGETDTQAHDHSSFFLFLSSLMTVIAWAGFVSLHDLLSCLVYSVFFGFVTAKATLNWTFPWNPANPFLTHSMDSFAFQYLLVYKCLGVFTSLWNPRDRVYPAILQQSSYVLAMVWPLFGLTLNATQMSGDRVLRDGIIWSALVGSFNMTLSFRAKEVLNFLRRESTASEIVLLTFSHHRGEENTRAQSGVGRAKESISLVFLNTIVVLGWTSLAMVLHTSALDYDLFLPAVALLFFCCEARALPWKYTSTQAWCAISVLWWYGSVFYHIFVRGYGESPEDNMNAPLPYSMFGWDEEISLWTSPSSYLPLLNLALSLVPYPAVFMALRRQRSDTEEMLFVLALLSAVAVIGASVDCVRYLGLMGVVAGGYRCYEISKSKRVGAGGDRYI